MKHIQEEKSHYLALAKLLINQIFENANTFKENSKNSKYLDSINFGAKLNLSVFAHLKKF